jgi:hypothetical protein
LIQYLGLMPSRDADQKLLAVDSQGASLSGKDFNFFQQIITIRACLGGCFVASRPHLVTAASNYLPLLLAARFQVSVGGKGSRGAGAQIADEGKNGQVTHDEKFSNKNKHDK